MSAKSSNRKLSKIEQIKANSNFLRESLATELLKDKTHFSEVVLQILKFHGFDPQDNRDNRILGQEQDDQMMWRTSTPGGFILPEFDLALDRISFDSLSIVCDRFS